MSNVISLFPISRDPSWFFPSFSARGLIPFPFHLTTLLFFLPCLYSLIDLCLAFFGGLTGAVNLGRAGPLRFSPMAGGACLPILLLFFFFLLEEVEGVSREGGEVDALFLFVCSPLLR